MTEDEIKQVGETRPNIDRIEVVEFESHDALKEWLGKEAPGFLRYGDMVRIACLNKFLPVRA
jgi:hypothetical protein